MSLPDAQIIFQHGWAFDADSFKIWEELLERSPVAVPDLVYLERGYFGREASRSVPEKKNRLRITVAHSLGLHLLPEEAFDCDLLVLISSFASFHPTGRAGERLSRKIIRRMLDKIGKLGDEPASVLREFHRSCQEDSPRCAEPMRGSNRSWIPETDKITTGGLERLRQDLELLDRVELERRKIESAGKILIMHGEEDRIVDLERALELKDLLEPASLVTFPGAGHALPYTGAPACIEKIREALCKQPCRQA
ncbi:MAG: alpha/beta hydrolase [Candidatus Melainabacteria bacterium]|nr:alpha/beta hydrolase [Candidatus Melainabacteria bacterium]